MFEPEALYGIFEDYQELFKIPWHLMLVLPALVDGSVIGLNCN